MADEKKPRIFRRRAYLEDFQKTVSGEYIYTGSTYTFASAKGMSRKQAITMLWLFGGTLFTAAIVQGLLPAGSMIGCAYVILPYAGMLICTGFSLWALGQLSLNRDPLRAYIYRATVEALPGRSLLAFIFSSAAFIGQLIYLIAYGAGSLSVWMLVLFALDTAAAFLLYRTARMLEWKADPATLRPDL